MIINEFFFAVGEMLVPIFQNWIGSMVIGVVLGTLITFVAQKVLTSASQLMLVTFTVTNLAFFVCEDVVDFSGVVAVASIGLVMGHAKNSFAGSMGKSLGSTWGTLSRVAETIGFVFVGMEAVDRVSMHFDQRDLMLALVIYIICKVTRIVVFLVLLPVLSRMGSGLRWQNAAVAMWSRMNGILGILMMLMANQVKEYETFGPQLTTIAVLMVLLTHLINGSSITVVLSKLGLLTVSSSRRANMRKALANLQDVRERYVYAVGS
ncbi:sodium/hydrogen exchanger 10-like [Bacillus rossius redtenbacheri]|uniref:sodium/hydrogen exchanger 10-like n=1 Tax=Bacillus rossius redtenbacheri TaxID=93214 RepID=UPI002FDDB057